jgi:hypothetical protein
MAPNYEDRQEFWKPVVAPRAEREIAQVQEQTCASCGTDYVLGSRFCHVCGADRQVNLSDTAIAADRPILAFRETLGQSTASLVSLVLGVGCVIAAIVTGFLFTANNLLDWQAIQIWRIEWLLAAVAIFVAGLLLKKK